MVSSSYLMGEPLESSWHLRHHPYGIELFEIAISKRYKLVTGNTKLTRGVVVIMMQLGLFVILFSCQCTTLQLQGETSTFWRIYRYFHILIFCLHRKLQSYFCVSAYLPVMAVLQVNLG